MAQANPNNASATDITIAGTTASAPHVELPLSFSPVTAPVNRSGQVNPGGNSGGVVPGAGPGIQTPRALPQWLQGFFGFFNRQNNVSLPVTAGFTGGPVSTVPGILGGVQGFVLPPGVPNSVQNRY
jgi:hypothetical protein